MTMFSWYVCSMNYFCHVAESRGFWLSVVCSNWMSRLLAVLIDGRLHIVLRRPTASNACFRPDLIESTKSKATLWMLAHYPASHGFVLCARGLVGFAHLQRRAFAGFRAQFTPLLMIVFSQIYLNRLPIPSHWSSWSSFRFPFLLPIPLQLLRQF